MRANKVTGVVLIFVAHGLIACGPARRADEAVKRTRQALSSSPWTKIAAVYPGGGKDLNGHPMNGPANVALLTDGSVLCSDPQRSDGDPWYRWYRLWPDSTGSYANGTFTQAASSSIGRQFAPSFVLPDGRYFICGGEYTSDPYELAMHSNSANRARCEIYDPVNDTWTDDTTDTSLNLGETIADTAAVELDDGSVLTLANQPSNTYVFKATGNTFKWSDPSNLMTQSSRKAYPSNLVTFEGSCTLQQDGRVFCAHFGFVRYQPGANGTDSWTPLTTAPLVSLMSFNGSNYEIGPALQLYDGRMMVLGANSKTSSNGPPQDADAAILDPQNHDAWTMAPKIRSSQENGTPALNHGDSPAVVMPDGRVLAASDLADSGLGGVGPSLLHEFDPSAPNGGSWSPDITLPNFIPLDMGAGIRLLDLPSGEVLVTGATDSSFWLYKPSGTPSDSWRPAITQPISGPDALGRYTLTGTQLNGLTTGGEIGDDAVLATNYPIVYLLGNGRRYYARSSTFSHMAPTPNQTSTCKFRLPDGIPNGTYLVFVAANGLSSSAGRSLTIGGSHVASLTPTSATQATITLSQPAPMAGTTVSLTSSDPNTLAVPGSGSITIPFNSVTATVNLTVNAFGTAVITATTSNSPRGPITARMGWRITSLSGPSVVYGDRGSPNSVPWYITISSAAPGNAVVTLTSSNTDVASVPATVTIPQGRSSAAIFITKANIRRGISRITASAANTARTWTFSDRDVDFFKCAGEAGPCFSSILQRYIAYGDNGFIDGRDSHYAYGTSTAQTTTCSPSSFNNYDPDVGIVKSCYLSVYGSTGAKEGGAFTLTAPANVAYGGRGGFVYKQMQPGTYTCGMSTFDNVDPAWGVEKSCFIGPDPNAYTWVADEGGSFSNQSSIPVAYGANGHFVFTILNGTIACNNDTFGDPAPNAAKSCYKLKLSRLAANEGQAFVPTVSQTIYGSGLNGNMFFSSSAPSECSFMKFGGDPDFGFVKHCWAE